MLKKIIIPLSLGLLVSCSPLNEKPVLKEPILQLLWTLNQSLSRPESVLYDAAKHVLYVSNIQGNPTKKDGNGYISIVSVTGKVLKEKWVTGLDAPKGMTMLGDRLYVSDIDSLAEISIETGQVIKRYKGEGAKFLNDVAIDDQGNVYVSDSKQKTIYRLHNKVFSIWVSDNRISKPNGVFVQGDSLIVAAGDSAAKKPHRARFLHVINLKSKKITNLAGTEPLGSLDGIEDSGVGGYFLTDFRSGNISYFTKLRG